jgi:hypothetical protein
MRFLYRLLRSLDPFRRKGTWLRDTPWRQGSVLPEAATASLGLREKFSGYPLAMVISHSCDVVNNDLQREPEVEVVAIRVVDRADPNFTYAKNPRVLHLIGSKAETPIVLEAAANNKARLSKLKLSTFKPDDRFRLEGSQLRVLQDWLAARYKRAAFPDKLAALLSKTEKTLLKVSKDNPEAILDVFVDYDPEEPSLEKGELYEVTINIVYSPEIANAKTIAETAAARLRERFEGQFNKDGNWVELELRGCLAISEAELTYSEMRRMKRYKLDYISLRESLSVDPSDE